MADSNTTPKRRPGRPATGQKDVRRIMIYLQPKLDAAVRAKIAETGQSLTDYFSHLARMDVEGRE